MARFYGEITGRGKTAATRLGERFITGHIRGWTAGAEIVGLPDGEKDVFHINITGGSHNPSTKWCVGTLVDGGFVPTPALIDRLRNDGYEITPPRRDDVPGMGGDAQ